MNPITVTRSAVESIFEEWLAEREQMFALTAAIEQLLRPDCAADPMGKSSSYRIEVEVI